MATVVVEMSAAGLSRDGASMPVMAGQDGVAEVMVSGGASSVTAVQARNGWFVSIFNTDTSQLVWGVAGQAPVAAVGAGFSLGPGERREFGPLKGGDMIALIDG